jgi:uncharacterized protein YdeI (YjbR/CyaY-like superfamily)
VVCPQSPQQWRAWLQAHHTDHASAWLVYYKKNAAQPTLTWSEALCFGWIDSQAQPVDAARYMQFFSRRKPTSGWSKVNKEKVQRLQAAGRMTPAGLASLATAQRNGSWALLDDVDALRIPPDLAQALAQHPHAAYHFARLSRTAKRYWLRCLVQAKRAATRQRRIAEILALAPQPHNHTREPLADH